MKALILTAVAVGMALLFWLFWFSVPAGAQTLTIIAPIPCDLTVNALKDITEKYEEKVRAAGLSLGGDQVRLFVSETGTFTMIITRPSGITCTVAMGYDWTEAPAQIDGDDS